AYIYELAQIDFIDGCAGMASHKIPGQRYHRRKIVELRHLFAVFLTANLFQFFSP
ncbi:unnamed protein product, partial [marine sediment metagenome]